jgi:nicotinate-nucleotide adenylyltransferase
MRRIGIFGGSFNPIHNGHAIIASYIMQHGGLDQLWLMVSPQNPLKQPHEMAGELHRLRMTEMVSHRIDGVETSAFEFTMPRPSYTIDTLHALQDKFPDDEFWLVIGADNWAVWDRWRSHDEIIQQFHVLIYPRLGYEVSIPDTLTDRVRVVNAPIIELSSTTVRDLLSHGQSIAFYVPADVEQYIVKHQLYTLA